jgi:N6-adenosine-specific RNA methylase IME4
MAAERAFAFVLQHMTVDGRLVRDLAEGDAHLYLWVTNNKLLDGFRVMKAWGFEYKTLITWAKDRFGLGQYYRGQTEHVIFAVRGVLPYRQREIDGKRAQGRTLIDGFDAPREEHSVKPEVMREWIESVSHGPYIELFARRPAPGWDIWGNEVGEGIIHCKKESEVEANGCTVPGPDWKREPTTAELPHHTDAAEAVAASQAGPVVLNETTVIGLPTTAHFPEDDNEDYPTP